MVESVHSVGRPLQQGGPDAARHLGQDRSRGVRQLMSDTQSGSDRAPSGLPAQVRDRNVNAVSGGLILIWVGIILLAHAGWGLGLVGVGIIILGEQAYRRYSSINFDKQWVVAGACFVLGGNIVQYGRSLPLLPILLIAAGIVLIAPVVRRSRRNE